MTVWNRLEKRWNELQVGRQGSYSIERLESFDSYCKVTSRTRAILVCLVTPLPALIFVVLLESLPLRPPSEGWRANWIFWLRLAILVFTLAFSGMSEMATLVADMKVTFSQKVTVAAGTSIAYVATTLAVSIKIGFPLPFIFQVGSLLGALYVPVILVLVFGMEPFTRDSPCRPHLQRFHCFHFACMALVGIYPFYKAPYDLIPVAYRSSAALVLPLWRFGAKYFMMKATRELEDFIPQIVAFTVDLYSSLFVSVCMSGAGSLYLSAIFITVDFGQTWLEFREIQSNANAVLELIREHSFQIKNVKTMDLLAMILSVTRNPSASHITYMHGARLQACLSHPLPKERVNQLQLLAASGSYPLSIPTSVQCAEKSNQQQRQTWSKFRLLRSISVAPTKFNVVKVSMTRGTTQADKESQQTTVSTQNGGAIQSKQFVLQGLQLLFHCEYSALVEYIECVVPLVYVVYKSVLEYLPNNVHFPGGAGNWGSLAVVNILVFAALEIVSFLLFHLFLQRKFAVSPLYQVAFVVETLVHLVQSKLFLSLVDLLQYELAHLGEILFCSMHNSRCADL